MKKIKNGTDNITIGKKSRGTIIVDIGNRLNNNKKIFYTFL